MSRSWLPPSLVLNNLPLRSVSFLSLVRFEASLEPLGLESLGSQPNGMARPVRLGDLSFNYTWNFVGYCWSHTWWNNHCVLLWVGTSVSFLWNAYRHLKRVWNKGTSTVILRQIIHLSNIFLFESALMLTISFHVSDLGGSWTSEGPRATKFNMIQQRPGRLMLRYMRYPSQNLTLNCFHHFGISRWYPIRKQVFGIIPISFP